MSLSIPYENIHDAQMRLQGTVVLYDGDPVYITEVAQKKVEDPKDDIFRVYASPLPYQPMQDKAEMRKFISSKKFDMAPFPMGFMNYDGLAYYCTRLPRKQQRQGLSNGTFSSVPVGFPDMGGVRFEQAISMKEFDECVKGKYPSFDEALKRLAEGEANSVGFTRCFAVVSDKDMPELVYLYHKKEKVGFVLEDRVKLSKAGKCLVEALREANVRC